MPLEIPSVAGKGVCAVIVTFNRLALLQKSVENLRRQTRLPDEIIVVNNGSSDGTAEWLNQETGLRVITQENLGGAGGFHTGMQAAHQAGYDWIWMMDDDLVVPEGTLELLLHAATNHSIDVLNPVVAALTEPEVLAFGLSPEIRTVAAAQGAAQNDLIDHLINPFNGTLINRTVIDRIGLVKAEMFISGDEVEYALRAKKGKIRIATLASAICLHPKDRSDYQPILANRGRVEVPKGHRFWIYARNLGYINSRYRGFYTVARDCLKYCWYFLATPSAGLPSLREFLSYYRDGINDTYHLPPTRRIAPEAASPRV